MSPSTLKNIVYGHVESTSVDTFSKICVDLDILLQFFLHQIYLNRRISIMGTKIKDFPDGAFLEYDRGQFDDWCVYMNQPNGLRRAPLDRDYFNQLQNFAGQYGVNRIYNDYVQVYNLVGKTVDDSDLDKITNIALNYGDDALELDKIFSILYMAMIAEERKAFTKLGKRIKRLGIHKLLIEGCTVQESANFMKGMG